MDGITNKCLCYLFELWWVDCVFGFFNHLFNEPWNCSNLHLWSFQPSSFAVWFWYYRTLAAKMFCLLVIYTLQLAKGMTWITWEHYSTVFAICDSSTAYLISYILYTHACNIQIVWADSNRVGCGAYRCPTTVDLESYTNLLYLVCNYGPGWEGQSKQYLS